MSSKDIKVHITNLSWRRGVLYKIGWAEADAQLEKEGHPPRMLQGAFKERADRIAVFAIQALSRTSLFAGAGSTQQRRFALYAFDWVLDADGVALLLEVLT